MQAAGIENPVALPVTGVDARHHGHRIMVKTLVEGIGDLFHDLAVAIGWQPFLVTRILPGDLDAEPVQARLDHIVHRAAACHQNEVPVLALCGSGPPVVANSQFCHVDEVCSCIDK